MSVETEWFGGYGVDDNVNPREIFWGETPKMKTRYVLLGLAILFFMSTHSVQAGSETFRGEHPRDSSPIILTKYDDKPCTNELVLGFLVSKYGIMPALLATFKESVLTYEGKNWASCWIKSRGRIFSFDEEGAPLMPIPEELFKAEGV